MDNPQESACRPKKFPQNGLAAGQRHKTFDSYGFQPCLLVCQFCCLGFSKFRVRRSWVSPHTGPYKRIMQRWRARSVTQRARALCGSRLRHRSPFGWEGDNLTPILATLVWMKTLACLAAAEPMNGIQFTAFASRVLLTPNPASMRRTAWAAITNTRSDERTQIRRSVPLAIRIWRYVEILWI